MKMLSASFFWRNNQPEGLGFTLNAASGWSPEDLAAAFTGSTVDEYFAASDELIGDDIVREYNAQLQAIAVDLRRGSLSTQMALIAALNIMWLTSRGFMPTDNFNGPMFVQEK